MGATVCVAPVPRLSNSIHWLEIGHGNGGGNSSLQRWSQIGPLLYWQRFQFPTPRRGLPSAALRSPLATRCRLLLLIPTPPAEVLHDKWPSRRPECSWSSSISVFHQPRNWWATRGSQRRKRGLAFAFGFPSTCAFSSPFAFALNGQSPVGLLLLLLRLSVSRLSSSSCYCSHSSCCSQTRDALDALLGSQIDIIMDTFALWRDKI